MLAGITRPMTWFAVSYDLAGGEIPPSADAGENGNRESFPDRTSPIREDPMNRTLAPAGVAHYDPRLAEQSTLPESHARSSGPCTRTL